MDNTSVDKKELRLYADTLETRLQEANNKIERLQSSIDALSTLNSRYHGQIDAYQYVISNLKIIVEGK